MLLTPLGLGPRGDALGLLAVFRQSTAERPNSSVLLEISDARKGLPAIFANVWLDPGVDGHMRHEAFAVWEGFVAGLVNCVRNRSKSKET